MAQYHHYDGNGNVRASPMQPGAVVERYDYDAFGKLRNTLPLGYPMLVAFAEGGSVPR